MQGGVRKRGSTWSYYFDLGKVDGKRKKKEKGGFRTKKDAEAALAAAMNEYNNAGLVFEPSTITVSDFLNFWFENYCKVNCKSNTVNSYKRIIDLHISPYFGKYRLKSITAANIQTWLNKLKSDGYSKGSITLYRDILSAALNYAVQPLQYIQSNPCMYVKLPKMEKPKEEKRFVISPDDFRRITERLDSSTPYYVPLMIGYYTGMRINEIYALTWDDIDLEERTISVTKTMIREKIQVKGDSPWYFNSPKTESSERVIKFGDALYRVLREAKQKMLRNRLKYGEKYIDIFVEDTIDKNGIVLKHLVYHKRSESCSLPRVSLICTCENGAYSGADNIRVACRKVTKELGIKFNFHSLRHTHATMLIENGASFKAVSERLGHANVSVTMEIYSHNTEYQQNEAVNIFEQLVNHKQA